MTTSTLDATTLKPATTPVVASLFDLAARFGLSAIFLISGLGKLTQYAGTQAYMQAMGVPSGLLPIVIAVEVLGGAALLSGLYTRWAAFLLAGFSLVSAALFHADFGDQIQQIMFLKNLAMTGGLLAFVVHGAGAWSLDRQVRKI